jgi:hypothetical protein
MTSLDDVDGTHVHDSIDVADIEEQFIRHAH